MRREVGGKGAVEVGRRAREEREQELTLQKRCTSAQSSSLLHPQGPGTWLLSEPPAKASKLSVF